MRRVPYDPGQALVKPDQAQGSLPPGSPDPVDRARMQVRGYAAISCDRYMSKRQFPASTSRSARHRRRYPGCKRPACGGTDLPMGTGSSPRPSSSMSSKPLRLRSAIRLLRYSGAWSRSACQTGSPRSSRRTSITVSCHRMLAVSPRISRWLRCTESTSFLRGTSDIWRMPTSSNTWASSTVGSALPFLRLRRP